MKAFLLIPVFVLVFEAGQIRGAIEGFVTRAGTADPVTGASVVLAGAGTVVRTATDLSGYFRFDNLVADHYKLDVSREGYFARSADGAILRVQSQPLELQDQNVQFVAVSLHKLGEIAGYVSDSNGRAVSDVRVQAMRLGHEGGQLVLESGRSTRSNLEGYPGQYLIPALEPRGIRCGYHEQR